MEPSEEPGRFLGDPCHGGVEWVLDTDIESAVSRLDQPLPEPTFTLPRNLFHVRKAEDKATRRGIKRLIRPENARAVLDHLPVTPDDRTHCILRGDFVLCDLIPQIADHDGGILDLRIATLGLSVANASLLRDLLAEGKVATLTLIVSHYFQQVDKATTFAEVATILDDERVRLVVTRSHAKVICMPTGAGNHFVLEGSANLRSSDNLEQMLLTNDPETHAFHAAWIDQLATS